MPFTKLRQLAMSYRFEGTMSPKRVFLKAKKSFRLGVTTSAETELGENIRYLID